MPALFTKPIKFEDALKSRRVKKVLPTKASAAELAKLEPEIRERARFLARVNHAGAVTEIHRQVDGVLGMDGEQFNPATARANIKKHLKSIGYDPENPPKGFEEAKPGSIKDISSDGRLNLVIDTNLKMAHGYGQFSKANDPDLLDAYPCQELYRLEERKEKRKWLSRWVQAGGQLYGPNNDRMIARKDSKVWKAISAFDLPYPPFDYNSGMWVEEIDREEAETLGVIKPSDVVAPQDRGFNDTVSGSLSTDTPVHLQKAIRKVFADDATAAVKEGRLVLNATAKDAVEAIDEVYEVATSGKGKLVKDYAMVTPAEAERVKEAIDMDVTGYRHAVDADAIRHIIKQHGDEATELPRGQLAVELADLEKIPEIVARGAVEVSTLPNAVMYSAEIGDSYYYVEEVRKKSSRMMAKTMWKRAAPVPRATQ